ncbi:polyamine acetyltransferase [Sclerotinia borealis F-4128]|uniref:Polyamine acetyltransferase n=1 Tax=Sclerotinia borealis (strain F-4128) TaxID=1432307 RepID=W9CRJ3_SCLBF|nr:polyamine acetyltransferase [Sclerotinia borealis F-4128]
MSEIDQCEGTPQTPILSESPNPVTPQEAQRGFVIIPDDQQNKSFHMFLNSHRDIHPYTRPLTTSDLESVLTLENTAFLDPNERASREKLRYRLNRCGELCLGIFCTMAPGSDPKIETLATGHPVETSRQNGAISVLIGHVIATKTHDLTASDASMGVPEGWEASKPPRTKLGHQEYGRTIVLHSVAILPAFQGRGLGKILMAAYMQQMNGAGIADRLVLIAHDHKVNFYKMLGFTEKGKSEAQFGGGGWYDMVYNLKTPEARTAYG